MSETIPFGDLLEHFDEYRGRRVRVVFKPQPRVSSSGAAGPPKEMYTPEVIGVLADFVMGAFRLEDGTLCEETEVVSIEMLPPGR